MTGSIGRDGGNGIRRFLALFKVLQNRFDGLLIGQGVRLGVLSVAALYQLNAVASRQTRQKTETKLHNRLPLIWQTLFANREQG